VTITAIVQNGSKAVVTNAPVTFSTSSGIIAPAATATAGSVAGVTDSNGEAQATLTTPGDFSNRTITVTATVGTVSATINVAVVGTKMTLTGPTSLILGASGTFSAALNDSGGAGIPNTTVTLNSANGNTLSAQSLTTDNTGHITFTVTAANSGNDTVTATALGLSATAALSVSSQKFSFTSPASATSVALNTPQAVTLVWTNNGTPVANQQVSFSTTRGTFTGGAVTTTATTDGTGTATVSLSSSTAGPALVTATAPQVSAQLSLQFVATTPARVDVQASPASVVTSGQSTITAIVWDANNNLVQGQTVAFQLTDKTGGSISVASAVTNAQGVAQTVYQATSASSAANGVTVTASVQGTAISNSVNLTVGGQSLFLSLGTGNLISIYTPPGAPAGFVPTQFEMPWTVQALDASGNAVSGVTITFSIHSLPYSKVPPPVNADGSTSGSYAAYFKGAWTPVAGSATSCNGITGLAYCQIITAICYNEDVNGSGILQSPTEDINGNGKLDPGDVAAVTPGSGVSDASGSVAVNVIYPQDHAAWVQVLLTATATVQGTESAATATFVLPMLAKYINDTSNGTPPGYLSPYGQAALCTDPK
jgi:hypothetical protein